MGNNPYKREYPCLYRGVVEVNKDPEKLGRCRVRIPSVHGEKEDVSILPWARPCSTSVISKGRGAVNLPDVGDIVWVLFEGADKDFPVYIGGTYGKEEIPVKNEEVDFYREKEDLISYNREDRVYEIQLKDNKITADLEHVEINLNDKATIEATESSITLNLLDESKITMDDDGITIHSDKAIKLSAPRIDLNE